MTKKEERWAPHRFCPTCGPQPSFSAVWNTDVAWGLHGWKRFWPRASHHPKGPQILLVSGGMSSNCYLREHCDPTSSTGGAHVQTVPMEEAPCTRPGQSQGPHEPSHRWKAHHTQQQYCQEGPLALVSSYFDSRIITFSLCSPWSLRFLVSGVLSE